MLTRQYNTVKIYPLNRIDNLTHTHTFYLTIEVTIFPFSTFPNDNKVLFQNQEKQSQVIDTKLRNPCTFSPQLKYRNQLSEAVHNSQN